MKTFNSLMKDLNEEGGETLKMRVATDTSRFEEALKNFPLKVLNVLVLSYICFNTLSEEGKLPLKQIARDLKLKIEIVKKAIMDLKEYGVLVEINNKKRKER